MFTQLELFAAIESSYAEAGGDLPNKALYGEVARRLGLPAGALAKREPVGKAGAPHNLLARSIRWWQQSAKMQGLLERDGTQRGLWRLTRHKKTTLTLADAKLQQVAFSTKLGVALWARCECVQALDEPVALCVTSPPYPGIARAYGNVKIDDYIDFVCNAIGPYIKSLTRGGSLALNVGNNLFLPGTPGRSSYWWRLGLAIEDRFGLVLMDTLCWHNTSAAPGPTAWASKSRQQLNASWEPVLWFTNDPNACLANNRRVLKAHTQKHSALMAAGGETTSGIYADGAYRRRPGAFGQLTEGAIPRNVLAISHTCRGQRRYKALAREAGLPAHGAPFPEELAKFLVRFLTDVGQLVVDPMAGSMTVPAVCEELERPWLAVEQAWEYCAGGGLRLHDQGASLSWGYWFGMERPHSGLRTIELCE